jgi:predicted cupin superfamily sugar epimerase
MHPEGGFYKEVYRSAESYQGKLPDRFAGDRSFATSIYFLLRSEDRSVFHRIKSDELWHFYAGSSLTLYILSEQGLRTQILGSPENSDGSLQVVIPANCWFGALVNNARSYVLSGCTVAPGFDFADFEIAKRKDLVDQYPQYTDIILRLT